MIRKTIYFASGLLQRVIRVSREQKITFSRFIQKAAERFSAEPEKARLEKDLEKGYQAKAQLNLLIAKDFEGLDGQAI